MGIYFFTSMCLLISSLVLAELWLSISPRLWSSLWRHNMVAALSNNWILMQSHQRKEGTNDGSPWTVLPFIKEENLFLKSPTLVLFMSFWFECIHFSIPYCKGSWENVMIEKKNDGEIAVVRQLRHRPYVIRKYGNNIMEIW